VRWTVSLLLLGAFAAIPAQGAAPGAAADLGVRGVVHAVRDATIASDVASRVVRLPVQEGEAFRAGDVLVEFDCDKPRAELRAAEAEAQVNRIAADNARLLDARRAIGRIEVQAANARFEKAKAAADALDIRVRDCRIVAPFSGRVAELRLHEHEMAAPGQALMRLVDAGSLEIDLIVPSTWLGWLRIGSTLSVRIEETGLTYGASVSRTAAAVDPVSQTVKITAVFQPGDISAVLPGMSLEARFPQPGK
jgi:membrane fusion protein (multidrug efflux system)